MDLLLILEAVACAIETSTMCAAICPAMAWARSNRCRPAATRAACAGAGPGRIRPDQPRRPGAADRTAASLPGQPAQAGRVTSAEALAESHSKPPRRHALCQREDRGDSAHTGMPAMHAPCRQESALGSRSYRRVGARSPSVRAGMGSVIASAMRCRKERMVAAATRCRIVRSSHAPAAPAGGR